MTELEKQGQAAQKASKILALASSEQKNQALDRMAAELLAHQKEWLEANRQDVEAAGKAGMNSSFSDRLTLTEERIKGIVEGLRQVALLTDPVGQTDRTILRPNGLRIQRKRVPLGVIALIFEARPNVVADAAALCLKSGNACILRGGKEAIRSNTVAVELMRRALSSVGLPEDCISLVKDTSRDSATELMHLHDYVDVLFPRGGAGLIRAVMKEASVPVIRTGEGVCHVYIDKAANLSMGANILINAKCSRPAVCNAAECLLVHRAVAKEFLEKALPLLEQKQVELRCDSVALEILDDRGIPATAEDWDAEYGDYILAVKTVESEEEAIAFIARHGTGHSECIVTEDEAAAAKFLNEVDAAAVYLNASTRFTDGSEFGLGAEIGISTQKLHARGPMGLEELTGFKYVVTGNGQIR